MTISPHIITALAPLPVLVPMLAAAATLVLGRRPRAQRIITLVALIGVLVVSGLLLFLADRDGTTAHSGGWLGFADRHHAGGRPAVRDDAGGLVDRAARRHGVRRRVRVSATAARTSPSRSSCRRIWR